MELEEMTVEPFAAAKVPYQFMAKKDGNSSQIVNIVMPLGGSQSALFRYPKSGERVLVGVQGDVRYLLGYLPGDKSNENNIHTGKNNGDILPDEKAGQFFRYKGPGNNPLETDGEENFSEIGYYHELTGWKKAKDDNAEAKVTTLKVNAKGDIHHDASNHQRIRAKRFELLVNCRGETDKQSDDAFAFGDKSSFGFGDRNGDETDLLQGDAHIRAKNRVVIKAEKEIRLQVGRSSIVISDAGIHMATRRTRSNIENGWDTVLKMTPLDGLYVFGQKVSLTAGHSFELADIYGGSLSSSLGVARLTGFDVRLATMGTTNYILKGIINGADFVANLITMSLGASGVNGPYGQLGSDVSSGLRIGGGAFGGLLASSNLKEYDVMDAGGMLLSLTRIILLVLNIVGKIIENLIPEQILREKPEARDVLYTILSLLEYGILLLACAKLAASGITAAFHECVLHLSNKAEIRMDAKKGGTAFVEDLGTNTPIAGVTEKSAKEIVKGGVKKLLEKLNDNKLAMVLGGIPAILAAGGVAGTYFGVTAGANKNFEEELRRL